MHSFLSLLNFLSLIGIGPVKDLEEEKLGSQMVYKKQLGPTNDE